MTNGSGFLCFRRLQNVRAYKKFEETKFLPFNLLKMEKFADPLHVVCVDFLDVEMVGTNLELLEKSLEAI